MYRNERGRLWALGAAVGIAALAAPAAQAIVTVGTISTPTPNSRPTATAVAPNQTVWIPGGQMVINEQTVSSTGAFVVNALHVTVNGVANLVLASATAGIS